MSISLERAIASVRERRTEDWAGTWGTLYVSPEGYADDRDFLVVWGAHEYLVDNDPRYLLLNNLVTFVDRETGEIRDVPHSLHLDKIDAMEPVSTGSSR